MLDLLEYCQKIELSRSKHSPPPRLLPPQINKYNPLMMLWDVIGQDNSLNSLLSRPTITWPQLLSHETILTEFKNQNKLLLQYINDHPEVFPEMLEYITIMPKESDSELRKFKLPFVSGEILAIQSALIYEAFFGIEDDSGSQQQDGGEAAVGGENLDKLLGYFKQGQLNSLLVGYCEKVFNNLFYGRRSKLLQRVFDKYCPSFVEHMNNMNVSNMMKKMLCLEPDKRQPETFLSMRKLTLECLLNMFRIRDRQFKANLVSILTEITTRRLLICDGEELFRLIISKPELYMDQNAQQIDQEAFRFVRSLLFRVNQKQAVEDQDSNIYLEEIFIKMLGLWFLDNIKFLQKSKTSPIVVIQNQNKKQVQPLGTARFSFIDTIREAIKMQNPSLNKILAENHIPERLLTLCTEYPYNGILHSAVRTIILELLKGSTVRPLFAVPLVNQIMETFKQPNQLVYGHLTDVFLAIQTYKDEAIYQKLSMPDVITFFQDFILPRKEKNQFKWAGNISNLHAGPHNFVDDEPVQFKSKSSQSIYSQNNDDFFSGASVTTSSKPSWNTQQVDEFNDFNEAPEQKQKPTTPTKPENNFNPFAAFVQQSKPKTQDFSAFGEFGF